MAAADAGCGCPHTAVHCVNGRSLLHIHLLLLYTRSCMAWHLISSRCCCCCSRGVLLLGVLALDQLPEALPHLLRMSTSAFLQTRLEKRRPIPRMAVMAYITFCLPSTLVFSTRRMCWKSSPAMRD